LGYIAGRGLRLWLGSIAVIGYFMRPMGAFLRLLFGASGLLALIPAGAFPGAVITEIVGAAASAALIAREIWIARARGRATIPAASGP
jgi:hypothetical protein